jgi:hypothetical protein
VKRGAVGGVGVFNGCGDPDGAKVQLVLKIHRPPKSVHFSKCGLFD